MIRFTVCQSGDNILEFTVTGHSGYGETGTDIVCAGVSALVYNAVNSCEALLGIELDASDTKDRLYCQVPRAYRSDANVQLLLHSLQFGIEQMAESYPKHVKVKYRQEME